MSTLFLINSCQIGGSELKTLRIANELSSRNVPISVAYLNSPGPQEGMLSDKVKALPLRRRGKMDLRVVKALKSHVEKNDVQRLFCINLYPSLYGFILKFFISNAGLKAYSFINVMDFKSRFDHLQMVFYAPILRTFSGLIFGCKTQKNQWISSYGLAPARCGHIYNGVDCAKFTPASSQERFRLREGFGFAPMDIVLACVAGLRTVKRHMDLLDACRALRLQGHRVRVVMVGEGPEKSSLVNAAKTAGLADSILFLGQMRDVRPVLAAADVFVLCSASETFSNAALEAMAMGKPIVISNTGGAAEMVESGLNGYTFDPGDMTQLISRLVALVEDRSRMAEMGLHARRLVQERFNFESMIQSYLRLVDTGQQ